MFGIGAGWNAEEMENHGTAFDTRWKVLEERIEAMKACWTQENSEYHGTYVDFDPIWSWPKPVQQPHPPIFAACSRPDASLIRTVNGSSPPGLWITERQLPMSSGFVGCGGSPGVQAPRKTAIETTARDLKTSPPRVSGR